jgi:hypothetical protein
MNDKNSGLRVIGSYSASECARKLRELGDEKLAREFDEVAAHEKGGTGLGIFGIKRKKLRPWMHISHNFGFIAPLTNGNHLSIVPAGSIDNQPSLIGMRLIVTLNRLFVAEYPGSGEHRVLFNFSAVNYLGKNELGEKVEEPLRFNMTVRARNGEHAAIIGWPIFSGLTAGPGGIAFECSTINVKNTDDEKLLSFIDSDVFRKGLDVLTVVQPAMKPLVAISSGLMQSFGQRNRNVAVQGFSMGLDSGNNPLGARLAEGDYVAVQAPMDKWNWPDVVYDRARGQLVNRNTLAPLNDFNYLVFGVTKMH